MATKTSKSKKKAEVTPTVPMTVTVSQFDGTSEGLSYERTRRGDIADWQDLTYDEFLPRGSTPLRDGTAKFIHELDGLHQKGQITVGILLDRSGSMQPLRESVVAGVNEFVQGIMDSSDLEPGEDGKVLAVVFTDGGENTSREYDAIALKSLTSDRESKGWVFIYLGANQDAWAQGRAMGLSGGITGQTINYAGTAGGTRSAMRLASSKATAYFSSAGVQALDAQGPSSATVMEDGSVSGENFDPKRAPGHRHDEAAPATPRAVDPKVQKALDEARGKLTK